MAVACDTDDCFAVYLAVEIGDDEDARSASEVSQLARDVAQGDGGGGQLRLPAAADDLPRLLGRSRACA